MKVKITENKLRKIVSEALHEIIEEDGMSNVSPLANVEFECKHIQRKLSFINDILTNIPKNTETIINEITEKLNGLGINVNLETFNYNDEGLTIYFNGDFNTLEQHQNYNSNNEEIIDFIGNHLGSFDKNVNYGIGGVFTSNVNAVYFDRNNVNHLEVEVRMNGYANPMFYQNMFNK